MSDDTHARIQQLLNAGFTLYEIDHMSVDEFVTLSDGTPPQ